MQPRTLKITVAVAIVVAVGTGFFLRLRTPSASVRPDQITEAEQPRDRARTLLRGQVDLPACRAILQHLNSHMVQNPDSKPPGLTAAERADLIQRLELTEAELAEVASPSFTRLDGIHLEASFLLREAARTMRSQAGTPRSAEQEATSAFAWVVRMIASEPGTERNDPSREYLLPDLALRRGFGSPLMRALVFLRLVEQLGHGGCLVAFPSKAGDLHRYWACGVLGSKNQIYLFDPRLGLPLPGRDGQGIASLGEVAEKASGLLRQLDAGAMQRYDVTAEQAAVSEIHLAPPLSALAPRMHALEKQLLPDVGRVSCQLSGTVLDFERALKSIGHPGAVRVAAWAARLQRTYYSDEDGGIDTSGRARQVRSSNVIDHLVQFRSALPEALRGIPIERFQDPPLDTLVGPFMKRMLDFTYGPTQPRDQLLRGKLSAAALSVNTFAEKLQVNLNAFQNSHQPQELADWFPQAEEIAAVQRNNPQDTQAQKRAQELQQKYARVRETFIDGVTAQSLIPQVGFLQALVKHEEAEQYQHDLATVPSEQQRKAAENLWEDAVSMWGSFIRARDLDPMVVPARWLLARAQLHRAELTWHRVRLASPTEKLGVENRAREVTQAAINLWEDLAGVQRGLPLSSLNAHFQVRQLKAKLNPRGA